MKASKKTEEIQHDSKPRNGGEDPQSRVLTNHRPSASGKDSDIVEAKALGLLTEDLCSLAAVAKDLRVHSSSIYRWAIRGVRGVVLETIRVGGKILTSRQSVTRFLERIQSPATRIQRPTRPGQKSRGK